jgi:hypothetical protein
VVFIGACDIGPVFKNLWQIQDGTTGQVLIVPTNQESSIRLGHAVTFWGELLYLLVNQHMQVKDAYPKANSYLLSFGKDADNNPITEQWQTVGDGSVRIN